MDMQFQMQEAMKQQQAQMAMMPPQPMGPEGASTGEQLPDGQAEPTVN